MKNSTPEHGAETDGPDSLSEPADLADRGHQARCDCVGSWLWAASVQQSESYGPLDFKYTGVPCVRVTFGSAPATT